MEINTNVGNGNYYRYKATGTIKNYRHITVEEPCTFEEALARAAEQRKMIDEVRK